ncbi:MAG: lytic transglycosylase domain-containing protein [Acidobacteria bacterium]|nr:lytic transglycosylase domain-containing protein [Acidobacteriota bacterium]
MADRKEHARKLARLGAGCLAMLLATGAAGGPRPAPVRELRRAVSVEAPRPAGDGPTHAAIARLVRVYRATPDHAWQRRLAAAIHDHAVTAGADPLLVAAIVASESSFRSRAVSSRGAVGLMQIRPWVAQEVAARAGIEWRGLDTLRSPEANIQIGVSYFLELLEQFDRDPVRALAAYRDGPTRVRQQLRDGTFQDNEYTRRVLGLYRDLADGVPGPGGRA